MKWNLFFLIGVIITGLVISQDLIDKPVTNAGELSVDLNTNNLVYNFDWGHTNITIYKAFANYTIYNKTTGKNKTMYNYTLLDYGANDVAVNKVNDKWEFTAIDNSLSKNELGRYKLVINSTEEMIHTYNEVNETYFYKYPVLYNYHENPKDYWNEFRHIFNYKYLCSKPYSKCEWIWRGDSTELYFKSYNLIEDKSIVNVSNCRTLDVEDEYYQLNTSINSAVEEECILIKADSVTFDLNSYSITDTTGGAIMIWSSSDYAVIKNGNVIDSSTGLFFAILSSLNSVINMTFDSNGNGLTFYNSSNNNVYNSSFIDNNIGINFLYTSKSNNVFNSVISGSATNDVKLLSISTNNFMINSTYDILKENVDATSYLYRKWYYRAYVNDSCNNLVENANVSIYNNLGVPQINLTTDGTGYTPIYNIIDYLNFRGVRTYYSNYSINVTHNDYFNITTNYNVTLEETNLKDVNTFTEPNITAFDGLINCSCNWNFNNNQNSLPNITFFDTGTLILNANWSFAEPRHDITGETGCSLIIKKGVEWI